MLRSVREKGAEAAGEKDIVSWHRAGWGAALQSGTERLRGERSLCAWKMQHSARPTGKRVVKGGYFRHSTAAAALWALGKQAIQCTEILRNKFAF